MSSFSSQSASFFNSDQRQAMMLLLPPLPQSSSNLDAVFQPLSSHKAGNYRKALALKIMSFDITQ